MNAHSPTPSATEPDGENARDAAAEEMAARHLAMLREMTAMGMDLARAVWRQGMAQAQEVAPPEGPAAGGVDPGLAYARITRAVRLAMAMEAKTLAEQTVRRARVEAAACVGDGASEDLEFVRRKISAIIGNAGAAVERQHEVQDMVAALVRRQVADVDRACGLLTDLRERLYDEESWDLDLERPIEEVIAVIARDLGLDLDGPGWEGAEEEGTAGNAAGVIRPPAFAVRPDGNRAQSRPDRPREGGDP